MTTYVTYPPRKMQSLGYTGPITISAYQRFQWVREMLKNERINLSMPTGNYHMDSELCGLFPIRE
jgi:arylsulfatase